MATKPSRSSPTSKNLRQRRRKQKSATDKSQHTPTTKMTHFPVPALNPAQEKLSVASPIRPWPLCNVDPHPRVTFIPLPRVAKPLKMSSPTPSITGQKGVLTGIDNPRSPPPQRSPNVSTDQDVAPLVPKAAPSRHSPRVAALNIQRQDIR